MKIEDFIKNNQELNIKQYKNEEKGAVYFICEDDGLIIYIGTTMNIYARIKAHYTRIEFYKKTFFFLSAPKEECLKLELKLILQVKPKFNSEWRTDKKYNVNKLSEKEIDRRKRIAQKDSKERKKIILKVMAEKNINTSKLAAKMGATRHRVDQILNNYNYPSNKTIKKLEKGLGAKLKVSFSKRPWNRDMY